MGIRSYTLGVVLSGESGKTQEYCIVVAHDMDEAIALATVNYPNLCSELVSVEKVCPIKLVTDKPVTINTVITAPDIPACVALIQAGRNGETTSCYSYIVTANNLEEVEIKNNIFASKHCEGKWHHVTNIYNTQRIDLCVDCVDLSPILKPFAVKLISGFDFTRKEEIGIVLADSEEDAVSRVEEQYAEVTGGLLEHRQIVPFDIGTGPCHIDFVITDPSSPSRLIHYGAREINFRTQTRTEIRDMPEKWQVCIFASSNKEVRAKTGLLTREFRTTGTVDYRLHGNLRSGKINMDFDAIML